MKQLFIGVLTAFCVCVHAQDRGRSITFGVTAGVDLQNINGKDRIDHTLNNKLVTRFHAGVNAEFRLAPDYYIQPGLQFKTKGAETPNYEVNIYYVELPVNFVFKPKLGKGHMLLGFGPYLSYAVGGRVKFDDGRRSNLSVSTRVYTDEEATTTVRPFDGGANFLVGYEFAKGFSFQLNAQLGLVDIDPVYEHLPSNRSSARNTGYGLSLGYRF